MNDRTLYEFQIGDIVAHRMNENLTGIVLETKFLNHKDREILYICWFAEGPASKKRYFAAHIVKVS
jgi:hypothetical protein